MLIQLLILNVAHLIECRLHNIEEIVLMLACNTKSWWFDQVRASVGATAIIFSSNEPHFIGSSLYCVHCLGNDYRP